MLALCFSLDIFIYLLSIIYKRELLTVVYFYLSALKYM